MAISRRRFITNSLLALSASLPIYWLWDKYNSPPEKSKVVGDMLGASHQRGHNLFKMLFAKPQQREKIGTVIIGGGVSGLSAARHLIQNNYDDFKLLDLEDQAGGNARYGENKTGRFPLGAHYLPIPSLRMKELISLLDEVGLITHFDEKGLPHYNEQHLCHDPDERLFINGHWQEGLIPNFGVPAQEKEQIKKFIALMDAYKNAIGSDGLHAFDMPIDASSKDTSFRELDKLSMKEFLLQHQLDSPYLHWYVKYCCKDDYGSSLEETSAWAGIHYFAGRHGEAGNADGEHVLTWPEGNGWLVEQLINTCKAHIQSGSMVFAVNQTKDKRYEIDYIDYRDNQVKRFIADKVIFSCPTFIQRHIKTNIKKLKLRNTQSFEYSTWVVANAELDASKINERNGFPLAWDNVIYGSQSLGYIKSTHQNLNRHQDTVNFTWYYLTPESGKEARKKALKMTHQDWVEMMFADMQKVYSHFPSWVIRCDVSLWGHAMIKPKVGFIWGEERRQALQNVDDSLFFAHTDLSGISVFEEGFYSGIEAAKQLLKTDHHA